MRKFNTIPQLYELCNKFHVVFMEIKPREFIMIANNAPENIQRPGSSIKFKNLIDTDGEIKNKLSYNKLTRYIGNIKWFGIFYGYNISIGVIYRKQYNFNYDICDSFLLARNLSC